LDPTKLRRAGNTDKHPAAELLAKLTPGMTATEWGRTLGWSDSTYRRKQNELVFKKLVKVVDSRYFPN
jgi:hypothetical protein